MAEDLWPYSQRLAGVVTDIEHETLWAGFADGLLPGQGSEALQTYGYQQEGGVQVQPGKLLISGHVYSNTTPKTVTVDGAAAQDRVDLIVAYINRGTSPWTWGVRCNAGTPGAGRPAISQSATGLYEVILRVLIRRSSGALDFGADERPWLAKSGLRMTYANLAIPSSLYTYETRGPARVYKYSVAGLTMVHVNGALRRDDGAAWSANQRNGGVMATIPLGYRPTYNVTLPTAASSSFAKLEIDPASGQMKLFSLDAGSSWVSLNGSYPILPAE